LALDCSLIAAAVLTENCNLIAVAVLMEKSEKLKGKI